PYLNATFLDIVKKSVISSSNPCCLQLEVTPALLATSHFMIERVIKCQVNDLKKDDGRTVLLGRWQLYHDNAKNNLLTKPNYMKRLQTTILGARGGRPNDNKVAEDVAKTNEQLLREARESAEKWGDLEPESEMEATEPESEDLDDEMSLMEADTLVLDHEVLDVDESV
ncbi:hypothetical protein HDU93_005540, partial [Gonapodya sp. JEL0774]